MSPTKCRTHAIINDVLLFLQRHEDSAPSPTIYIVLHEGIVMRMLWIIATKNNMIKVGIEYYQNVADIRVNLRTTAGSRLDTDTHQNLNLAAK